jgi:PadR family transcriptional regulator PadR
LSRSDKYPFSYPFSAHRARRGASVAVVRRRVLSWDGGRPVLVAAGSVIGRGRISLLSDKCPPSSRRAGLVSQPGVRRSTGMRDASRRLRPAMPTGGPRLLASLDKIPPWCGGVEWGVAWARNHLGILTYTARDVHARHQHIYNPLGGKKSPCVRLPTLCRHSTMAGEPRMTSQTLKVLSAIMSAGGRELSGAEISQEARLASGTLYPMLMRLEQCGWLESRWETEDPQALRRPRRRYYRITGVGKTRAQAAARELEPVVGRLAWA